MNKFPRARFGAAVAVAFICGLIFASGFDLTRFSWAQTRVPGVASGPSIPAPAVASLAETQNGFETIVDRVKPAVVSVRVAKYAKPVTNTKQRQGRQQLQQVPPGFEEFLKQFGGDVQIPDQSDQPREGSGSGFIVSKDGYILTNNHVVAGMDKVQVILTDKRAFTAKVIGTDPTTDVAVIKIDASDLPTVPLGDDATARVGQWVLAIGNPLELDFTVTAGIISAKGRNGLPLPGRDSYRIQDFIQTDKYGSVRRAIVGVALQEVTPEDAQAAGMKEIRGAKVVDFSDDASPAKRAGVELGDIILGVDGKPIDQVSTLQRIIRGFTVGQTVQLDIQRFGQRKQIAIKLTEAKPAADQVADNGDGTGSSSDGSRGRKAAPAEVSKSFDKLGITASTLPAATISEANIPAAARNGLLITSVEPRSDAWTKQVNKNYDVIEQVLYPVRRDIKSLADLDQAVSGLKTGDVITLRLYTIGGGNRVVSLRVP